MKSLSKIFILIFILGSGCQKLIEIDSPVNRYDAGKVYDRDASAIAVITSIYQTISSEGVFQGPNSITSLTGLLGDELVDYNIVAAKTAFYQNRVTPNSEAIWGEIYPLIYRLNSAIRGIESSSKLSPSISSRLTGEAKFLRAFFYFHLVNLWGEIPLPTTPDFEKNSKLSKSSVDDVYQLVISDLLYAEANLSDEYLLSDLKTETSERIRPNKWAAKALLARAYLYLKNYAAAEVKSNEIILNVSKFALPEVQEVFLNDSKETIWRIQPIALEWNTYDARTFVLFGPPNYFKPYSLNDKLLNDFEPGDNRASEWIGKFEDSGNHYYFSNKYKSANQNEPQVESLIILRLSEQYLIRAEARMGLNRIGDSVNDLNVLRTRARASATTATPNPLPNLPVNISVQELSELIIKERKNEFFCEMGHRWYDMKRMNYVDQIMGAVTPTKGGGPWNSYRSLLPIPNSEIQQNPNIKQNLGYN